MDIDVDLVPTDIMKGGSASIQGIDIAKHRHW